MNKLIITLFFLAGIVPMNAIFADTNYKQPMFSLEFNIFGTGAEIRLNDIPVYYSNSQGQTTSKKQIPESIIDGENSLSIKSFPIKEDNYKYQEGAYIEAIISVREKDDNSSENKPILQLKLNPAGPENQLIVGSLPNLGGKPTLKSYSEEYILVERRTNIKSPFPRWAWQDGQSIQNNPENLNSLLDKYQEIWTALNTGNIGNVRKLYEKAAQEFALAYHYNDIEQGHRLMNTGELIGNDDWVLADYTKLRQKMRYKLDIYANGQMAQIVDQDDRTPIIYLSKKVKMLNIQKFGFYKNQNGEWVMIR